MRGERTRAFVVALLTFFFSSSFLYASGFPPTTYLGIENGLSNNSVRCIYQDHSGFMWFGTFDGLNRYNGYDFKVFRNKISDTTSIVHNYITAIGEDRQNNLWIGTGQGIGIYNHLTSKFLPAFYLPFGRKEKERIPFNINSIKTDGNGNLYITTNGGGLLVKANGSDVAIQLPCVTDAKGICRNDVQSLVIDKKQRIWLFVGDAGLFRYYPETGKMQLVNDQIKSANCMEADEEGNLWIGTFYGLHKFNVSSGSLVRMYGEQPEKLTAHSIVSLAFDREKNLWIGTESGGINIVNPKTGIISYLLAGDEKNALSSESVFAIYEDNESRKWIGTLKGGINIIDPQKAMIQTVTHDPLNANSIANNFVSAFQEDGSHNLWIGTDGSGFSIWDRRQNTFTNYRHLPGNSRSLSHNSVYSFREDYLGDMWVATFGDGINKFNKANGTFDHYPCINQFTGEENKYVLLLYEDRDKNLWATTYADGKLYRLNRAANRFEVFCPETADLFSIAEDHAGSLWAGTAFGLVKVDKEAQTYTRFVINKPVRSIYEDKAGHLWVGTEGGGLILFDRKSGKIAARFTTDEGLCNNSVLNILEDNNGCLWLSTFNGISRFNPADKTFKNYYQEDGLQSNQFLFNAALRLQTGEMVFGGIKGFNILDPGNITSRKYNPPVLLTGLRINNTDVSAGSRYIMSTNGDKIEAVKIPYNEAVLSFDFAALEYSAPGKISYAYYLQGWDKGWSAGGNMRTAAYTKLSEGDYTLHIRATNAEGSWNPKEVRLRIVVLPPWYRSWWAYAVYILLAGGAIVLYQRYRANRAKLAYEIKLANLNAQKEKAERETERVINEKEKELAEKQADFFTNVSHEFRTPLTLVINPLRDLLRNPGNGTGNGELTTVYQNARRLLSLVDQLLLFRKTGAGADGLKIVKLDFCRLCKGVYLAFVQQAKEQQIEFYFECTAIEVEIYADREKLEIIFYNLLSNAFKYTPTGGKVTFTVLEMAGEVEAVVADTGYGIPKGTGAKLFERFYQVQEKGFPAKQGFGIGLYLVKHFTESHGGTIRYESEPGAGTSFVVRLKKGAKHFSSQPVFEESIEEPFVSTVVANDENLGLGNIRREKSTEVEELITDKQSVLVVDDDEQLRTYLVQLFSSHYTVYEAGNGEEGIHLAYQYLPDIIISDVKMPGISGIDFCKTIKQDSALSHIPVILLTAESSSEKILEGVEGGADDYITKPFETELLVAKVANQLKVRSNLQEYFYNEITLQKNSSKISEEYKEFLEKCIAVVEKHLDEDEFSVKALASELNMSHSTLYKKVKSISGQSVNAFIRLIRLRKAAQLFVDTDQNVSETAFSVGFKDIKYFRVQFSKLFGFNPSEYKKRYHPAFGNRFRKNKDAFGHPSAE